jgi:hypothetical protein
MVKVASTMRDQAPARIMVGSVLPPPRTPGHPAGWTCQRRFHRKGDQALTRAQLKLLDDGEVFYTEFRSAYACLYLPIWNAAQPVVPVLAIRKV